MTIERSVMRRAVRAYHRMIKGGRTETGPDGNPIHVLGSSLEEALAVLRSLPVPPPPPGSEDSSRDDVDPVAYRREMNRRKRARRARKL